MTIIKHALREIKKHPGKYLPIYAQIIVSVILFAFIAVTFQEMSVFSAKLQECTEHRNMYMAIDKSDVMTIMNTLDTDDAEEKCRELYEYTAECSNIYVHMANSLMWNGNQAEILQINRPFYDLYQMEVKYGRTFGEKEWSGQLGDDEAIPVLVGAKLAGSYPVGTTMVNEALDKSTFEVVGVLDENAFYLDPAVHYKTMSLDSAFVVPWIPRDALNNGYRNVNLFHVLQLETDDPEVLKKISSKSKELGLFDLDFVSFQDQIGAVEQYYQTAYSRDCAMLGVLLLYCVVGSIAMLLQYIDTHMKYSSIHMLCGATQRDTGLQMIVQVTVPVLIGIAVTVILFKNLFAFAAGTVFGMILLFIILVIPVSKWNRMQLSQIFKRYE